MNTHLRTARGILLLCACMDSLTYADFGYITMVNDIDNVSLQVCSQFNPSFAPYPETLDPESNGKRVVDIYPDPGCEPPENPDIYKGKIVFMKRRNCTFARRAKIVQDAEGHGIVVVSENGSVSPGGNATEYKEINITVSVIGNQSYNSLSATMQKYNKDKVSVILHAPAVYNSWLIDAIVMWAIAVIACGTGAWAQGKAYSELFSRTVASTSTGNAKKTKSTKKKEPEITLVHAVVFFAMSSVSILLMYYFYEYMVYVIISVFCLASSIAMFDLIEEKFNKSPCFTRHRLPKVPFVTKSRIPFLSVVLFLICVAVSIFWVINRKASYAWILQDILGFMFCVHMIKQLRLPNFKITASILSLFFIYDVFYVFITPFLTKNHESIMVNIATGSGGSSSEELPMLFKLPRLGSYGYRDCVAVISYSMLGFGDIILPGLHVGFCAVWDCRISTNTVRSHTYYIAAMIGYSLGLVLTYISMLLMATGQPALLYLTPCCLISTLLVALKRKELPAIWSGKMMRRVEVEAPEDESESLMSNGENAP